MVSMLKSEPNTQYPLGPGEKRLFAHLTTEETSSSGMTRKCNSIVVRVREGF